MPFRLGYGRNKFFSFLLSFSLDHSQVPLSFSSVWVGRFERPLYGPRPHVLPLNTIPRYTPDGCCPRYLLRDRQVSLLFLLRGIDGSDRNRTCDLLLAKQMLPQLSYAPKRKPPMSFSFLIDGVLLCLWFLPDPSTSSMDTMISRRMLRLNILLIPCKAIIRAHANKPSSGAVIFHDVDILYQSQHFCTSFP